MKHTVLLYTLVFGFFFITADAMHAQSPCHVVDPGEQVPPGYASPSFVSLTTP